MSKTERDSLRERLEKERAARERAEAERDYARQAALDLETGNRQKATESTEREVLAPLETRTEHAERRYKELAAAVREAKDCCYVYVEYGEQEYCELHRRLYAVLDKLEGEDGQTRPSEEI